VVARPLYIDTIKQNLDLNTGSAYRLSQNEKNGKIENVARAQNSSSIVAATVRSSNKLLGA